jgi:hypothetical protein
LAEKILTFFSENTLIPKEELADVKTGKFLGEQLSSL